MSKTAKQIVDFAVTRMIIKTPFFGTLVTELTRKPAEPDMNVAAFATDGKHLYYNEDFVLAHADQPRQLATGLAEAVMNCALHHPWRRNLREKDRYQAACRHEACEHLLKSNTEELAKLKQSGKAAVNPWDWPKNFPPFYENKFAGMVAEQVYNRLPTSPPSGGGGSGSGNGSPGQSTPSLCSVMDAEASSPAEEQEQEVKWDIAIAQAAAVAKAQGTLPASLELLVEKSKPKIPWTYHLRRFVSQFAKDDYSYLKPNMAAWAISEGEIILPSLHSETIGPVVVAVDTSGSIYSDPGLLDEFLAEIEGIHRECQPSELHFMDCDARVYAHRVFSPSDQLDLSVKGGGGTAFEPVFELVRKSRIEPACLIYLTDMMGSFPEQHPSYPVLWVSYSNINKAPFGEVIQAS